MAARTGPRFPRVPGIQIHHRKPSSTPGPSRILRGRGSLRFRQLRPYRRRNSLSRNTQRTTRSRISNLVRRRDRTWKRLAPAHCSGRSQLLPLSYLHFPRSVASENCRNEVSLALNRKKKFLSIYLEETELPLGLELRMGDLRAVLKYKMPELSYRKKSSQVWKNYSARKVGTCLQGEDPVAKHGAKS